MRWKPGEKMSCCACEELVMLIENKRGEVASLTAMVRRHWL